MLKKLFQNQKNIAGLDIGSSYIKWMEVSGEDISDITLTHYAVEPIPKEYTAENGDFKPEHLDAIAELVVKCWKKSGSKTKDVAIALPASQVITKTVILPNLELERDMLEQVENAMIPFLPDDQSLAETSIDYTLIRNNANSPDEYDTLIVGVAKEKMDNRNAIVETAGLNAVIVDSEAFAIQNMVRLMRGTDFNAGTYVVADCSATTLRLFAFRLGELVYTKDTPIGGVHLTYEIANNLGVSYEEAEKKKFQKSDLDSTMETYDMVEKGFLNNYVAEFMRAFAYFTSATSVGDVDEIVLTGGVAGLKGLEEGLASALAEDTDILIKNNPYIARPLEEMNKDTKISLNKFSQDEPGLFLVTSLALRKYLRQY